MAHDYEDHDDGPRRRGRDDYDDYERPRRRLSPVEAARQRLVAPGVFLAIAGGIGLLGSLVGLGVNLVSIPFYQADLNQQVAKAAAMPPGPARDRELEAAWTARIVMTVYLPFSVASSALGVVCNCGSLIGGLRMQSASGYNSAVVGAVCAVVPCGACCLLNMPAGVWALVVLLDRDAKAAFAAKRRRR